MKNQQHKLYFITAVFIFSLVFYSCKKDTSDNGAGEPVNTTFTSLKKGHRWVYSFKYNGTEYDSLTVQVMDEQMGVFEVLNYDIKNSLTDYRYVEGDYLKTYPKGKTKEQAQRITKTNAELGEMWKDFTGTDTLQTTVKRVGVQVSVPAGTFNCTELEVKNLQQKTVSYHYSHAAAGLVKILIYPNTGGIVVYELKHKNF